MTHGHYPWHMRAADTAALKGEEAEWDVQWNLEAAPAQLRIEYGSFKNEMGWTVQSAQQFAELRDWLTRAGSDLFVPLVNQIERGQTPTDGEFVRASEIVERMIARRAAETRRRAMAEANARMTEVRNERPRDSLVPGFTPAFQPVTEPRPLRRDVGIAAVVAAAGAGFGFVAGALAPFSSKPHRGMLGVGGTALVGAMMALAIWRQSRKRP